MISVVLPFLTFPGYSSFLIFLGMGNKNFCQACYVFLTSESLCPSYGCLMIGYHASSFTSFYPNNINDLFCRHEVLLPFNLILLTIKSLHFSLVFYASMAIEMDF